ncbi:hypothetical protein CSOJ01_06426 [Colletotrichum sojae]|uniref:Heterokaryon incompatibility domain-containing protein n=1 Tax=Colletotrichum sojae TaxID=2175907 RepID=A0A8H6JBY5_9PEZI|nr:hypothetical protein CSOJ01_06426 [Colletotrichum sojae]
MLPRTRPPADVFPVGSILPTAHLRIDIAGLRPRDPNPKLCARCRDWDVPAFAAGRCGKAHDYLPLTDLRRAAQSGCLVCSAVVAAADARRRECGWLRDSPERCVYVVVQGPFFLDTGHWDDQERRLEVSGRRLRVRLFLELTLCVVPGGRSGERPLPAPFAVTPQLQLTFHVGETTRLQAVEDWEVERFEVETLKKWLDGCEMLHGKRCVGEYGSKDDLPLGFRVIDVRRMSVIQPAEPVRFVALSYMWEVAEAEKATQHAQLVAANATELEAEHSLARIKLPRIILDTIKLCAGLGERYLWVDRLCIVQDDERSKPDQIQGMGCIYQSAAFTIMAALSDRKGGGLPGFSDQRRMARASLWGPPRNRNVGHGIEPNGVQTIVDPSLWNKRGWTFQERLLSKRRLFITEHQVLFECRRGQAAEELTWARSPTEAAKDGADAHARVQHIRSIPGFYRRSPYRRELAVRLGKLVSLVDYCHWVEDYTSRQLSHSADILEAFAGVANVLRTVMKSDTVFCLPEAFLPQSLMWSHMGIATRREALPWIPSWSWAAWMSAAAGYRWLSDDKRLVDTKLVRIVTLVSSFYYRHPTATAAGLRKLSVKERWLGSEMDMASISCPRKIPPLPRVMGGRRGGGRVEISEETSRMYEEMWRECPHNPWQALAHTELDQKASALAGDFPGALVFNTTVASLSVGRVHGAKPSSGRVMEAEILDSLGRQVGRLDAMDADWIAGRKGKRDRRSLLDFIVINAALEDIVGERNELVFIERQLHEMWRFNVMLVERLRPYEAFVARRIGVGYVRASQWKECNPRWETVILR